MLLGFCPQPPSWRWLTPRPSPQPGGPWLWVLLAVLAVELCMLPLRRPRVTAPELEVDGAFLVTSDWGERPVRRILPPPGKGDPSWQLGDKECRPPYEAINGYCWAGMDPGKFKPPCPGGLYEHQGRCLTPVVKKRPPTSIGR